MAKLRCIICEQLKNESEFNHGHFMDFCVTCKNREGNNELRRYRYIFNKCGVEIFCLRYPDALSTYSVSIPSDNEGKRKMLESVEEKINAKIRFCKKELERENTKEQEKELSEDLFQSHQYKAQVINLQRNL
jgi:hypothetical protein